jgi:hypothetical protein
MSKAADVPYETTLRVRDTCLCLHVQQAARALARVTPIWERTHAEVEARLADGDPDRLRSNLNALSSPTSVKQPQGPRRAP